MCQVEEEVVKTSRQQRLLKFFISKLEFLPKTGKMQDLSSEISQKMRVSIFCYTKNLHQTNGKRLFPVCCESKTDGDRWK